MINAERTELRAVNHKEQKRILPSLVIEIHNIAVRERIGSPRHSFVRESMSRIVDKLSEDMGDKDYFQLHELSSGTTERNSVKDFGLIRLEEARAEDYFIDPETNFILKKGQKHLRLHFLRDKLSKEKLIEGLEKVAEYVKSNEQQLSSYKYVVGITHSRIARISRRFGFTLSELSMPEWIRKYFADSARGLKPDVSLFFQSLDEIKKRFSDSKQSNMV